MSESQYSKASHTRRGREMKSTLFTLAMVCLNAFCTYFAFGMDAARPYIAAAFVIVAILPLYNVKGESHE